MSNQAHKTWAGALLMLAATILTLEYDYAWSTAGLAGAGAFLILMAQAPEGKT